MFRHAWLLLCTLLPIHAVADAARPGDADVGGGADCLGFKLTPAYYVTTNQRSAYDLNLRANYGPHAMWLGHYRQGAEFEQSRTGYEYTAEVPFGKIVPSLTAATHGYAGLAVNTEIGDQIYGLLGFGRTNLKDYYNLTFDPNDSIVFGFGTRLLPRSNVLLFRVQDDRLNTGQKVTHFVWRFVPADRQRVTVDVFARKGRPSAGEEILAGGGVSLTYDYADVFVRFARDNKVNFTPDNMARITLGFRF